MANVSRRQWLGTTGRIAALAAAGASEM